MHTDAVHQSQFVLLNESTTPVLSRLSYHADEPFAVTVAFRTERGRWIEWTFARDLLVSGLARNDPRLLLEALEAVDAGSIMEAA